MPFVSNHVLNNRGHFNLQLLHHFKDIAVFVVGSFSLLHPVEFWNHLYMIANVTKIFNKYAGCLDRQKLKDYS